MPGRIADAVASTSSKEKAARLPGRPLAPARTLEIVERSAFGLVATAAARVLPVHLDQPVMTAKSLVVGAAANRAGSRSEFPRTLVGIFIAAGVVPRVEIRIRDGLFRLMCHDRRHAVRTAVAVGA